MNRELKFNLKLTMNLNKVLWGVNISNFHSSQRIIFGIYIQEVSVEHHFCNKRLLSKFPDMALPQVIEDNAIQNYSTTKLSMNPQ